MRRLAAALLLILAGTVHSPADEAKLVKLTCTDGRVFEGTIVKVYRGTVEFEVPPTSPEAKPITRMLVRTQLTPESQATVASTLATLAYDPQHGSWEWKIKQSFPSETEGGPRAEISLAGACDATTPYLKVTLFRSGQPFPEEGTVLLASESFQLNLPSADVRSKGGTHQVSVLLHQSQLKQILDAKRAILRAGDENWTFTSAAREALKDASLLTPLAPHEPEGVVKR